MVFGHPQHVLQLYHVLSENLLVCRLSELEAKVVPLQALQGVETF